MKAKKLTKREWYLAAQWWRSLEDDGFRAAGIAEVAVRKEIPDLDSQYESFADRAFLYVQYCLERAGIPAGGK